MGVYNVLFVAIYVLYIIIYNIHLLHVSNKQRRLSDFEYFFTISFFQFKQAPISEFITSDMCRFSVFVRSYEIDTLIQLPTRDIDHHKYTQWYADWNLHCATTALHLILSAAAALDSSQLIPMSHKSCFNVFFSRW